MPAQQFTGMAVNHQRLDARPKANRTFLHLPTLELKDAPYGVFVEPQQPGHCAITERRRLLNHGFDGFSKLKINLGGATSRACNRPCAGQYRTSGTAWQSRRQTRLPSVPVGSSRSLLVLAQQGLQLFSCT